MNFKKDVLPLLIALIIASIFIELLKFGISKLSKKSQSYDESDLIGDYPVDNSDVYTEEVYYGE